MNKLHTAACLCVLFLLTFGAQAQTSKESSKSLYSITTSYEKARKKLVDQAYDKLGKITTAQERIGMSFRYALGNADNDDPEIKGSEIAELEACETSIALYIGFSQLSQLDQSSDEYYYKQLLRNCGSKRNAKRWSVNRRKPPANPSSGPRLSSSEASSEVYPTTSFPISRNKAQGTTERPRKAARAGRPFLLPARGLPSRQLPASAKA